jgi:hypothetical protein
MASIAAGLAKASLSSPELQLPPAVFKSGKTYRPRPNLANRKRTVKVPAGRQYLSTVVRDGLCMLLGPAHSLQDMLPVAEQEIVTDSEDDDGFRYQWESQFHQAVSSSAWVELSDKPDRNCSTIRTSNSSELLRALL